jgi:hypothetical protein
MGPDYTLFWDIFDELPVPGKKEVLNLWDSQALSRQTRDLPLLRKEFKTAVPLVILEILNEPLLR